MRITGSLVRIPVMFLIFQLSHLAQGATPYVVLSNGTETAEYWIERPYPSLNTYVDEYPSGTHRGNNDDDITVGTDDDVVDDDTDDGNSTLYTIIATGKG